MQVKQTPWGRFRIALPAPIESPWNLRYYDIDKECFTHKKFPYCKECDARYVPIDGKCLKCQIIHHG